MIDAAKQSAAIAAIKGVVAADAVIDDKSALSRFGSPGAPPAAVVLPNSLDEIAAVMKAASGAGGMIQSIGNGTGPDRRRAMPGVIVLDLQRMNHVLDVNADLAYCLVEPGVTYQQLADHLKANGQKLWIDNPGAPDQSVATSFIERQTGYTPYADHHLLQCGLEIMTADGRVVRTGMGAMPKSTCWQLFKFGYGPWVDGLFTQSNYAVVTKVGLWLMPEPPAYQPFAVTVANEQDLVPLMDTLRPLKINMVVPNGVAVANAVHEAALLGKRRQDFGGQGPMAAGAVADAAKSLNIGYWTLYGALYGLPANVDMAWQAVQGAFSAIPGAKVVNLKDASDNKLFSWRAAVMGGAVSASPGDPASWIGSDALIVHPMTAVDGEDAIKLYDVSRDAMARHGFDFIGEANAVWRATHHRHFLSYASGTPDDAKRAQDCAQDLITAQAAAGFGQVASDPSVSQVALGTYNGSLADLQRRVGTALDPNSLFARA